MNLIYRRDRMFRINETMLPASANNMEAQNNLLVAIFREFQGASTNEKYKNMSYQQRMEALNTYAKNWLDKQGYK